MLAFVFVSVWLHVGLKSALVFSLFSYIANINVCCLGVNRRMHCVGGKFFPTITSRRVRKICAKIVHVILRRKMLR